MVCTWFGEYCSCCCLPLLLNLPAAFSQPRTNHYFGLCMFLPSWFHPSSICVMFFFALHSFFSLLIFRLMNQVPLRSTYMYLLLAALGLKSHLFSCRLCSLYCISVAKAVLQQGRGHEYKISAFRLNLHQGQRTRDLLRLNYVPPPSMGCGRNKTMPAN